MALVDYLILTPLDEEWEAAGEILFPSERNERKIEAITYYLAQQPVNQPPDAVGEYLIVGAPMAHQTPGQAYAAAFSTHSLGDWKPARVVLLGIAGSLEPERLLLGDIVVSETMWGYEVGDAVGRNYFFRPTFNQDGALDIDRVRAFKRDKGDYGRWQRECVQTAPDLHLRPPRAPELHLETTASGNFVVKSVTAGRKLRKEIDKHISAVEMEGRGLHQALYLNAGRTDALTVRGISDYADRNKARLEKRSKNAWRAFAAGNAARLVRALWQRGPVPPLSPRYDLDLTLGSLVDFRRRRVPPIPSIEFKQKGAQDLAFPRVLTRTQPNPALLLKVRAIHSNETPATGYRGQCVLENADRYVVPGAQVASGAMTFQLPASEQGLRVELQLSFPETVHEVRLDCSDEFGRSSFKVWHNQVF